MRVGEPGYLDSTNDAAQTGQALRFRGICNGGNGVNEETPNLRCLLAKTFPDGRHHNPPLGAGTVKIEESEPDPAVVRCHRRRRPARWLDDRTRASRRGFRI